MGHSRGAHLAVLRVVDVDQLSYGAASWGKLPPAWGLQLHCHVLQPTGELHFHALHRAAYRCAKCTTCTTQAALHIICTTVPYLTSKCTGRCSKWSAPYPHVMYITRAFQVLHGTKQVRRARGGRQATGVWPLGGPVYLGRPQVKRRCSGGLRY